MPITRARDSQGRACFEFEFSRRIGGQRFRLRERLPLAWTRTQADAYDRKRSAEIYAQATGIESRRWLIDEAVACYLTGRAIELKAGKGTAKEIQNMESYWKGKPLTELPDVCAQFTKDHRAKLAPATIMNRLRYLIAACRYAWKHSKMGASDPGAGIPMPAVSNKRRVYVNRAEMLRIARACVHRPTRAAIRIAYYSGMRLGEIERAERTWSFGLEGPVFRLLDSKNGEPRIIPMHPKVRCCAGIKQGTRFQTGYHFRKARDKVGMGHVHFHDLRHAAAASMLRGGASMYEIGKVLGHKSQASTARYAHMEQAQLREAVGRIA